MRGIPAVGTQIMPEKNSAFESRYTRNLALLEYIEAKGSFRNTTVNGQSLDLGFIDDPLKGRAEASSKANRDKVWNWFTNDFFSRFSDHAAFLMVMTRWHLDDPMGRWLLKVTYKTEAEARKALNDRGINDLMVAEILKLEAPKRNRRLTDANNVRLPT